MQNLDPAPTQQSPEIFTLKPQAKTQQQTEKVATDQASIKVKGFKLWPQKKRQQILLIIGMFFLVILATLGTVVAFTYRTALQLKSEGQVLQAQVLAGYDEFKGQNLPGAETNLIQAQEQLLAVQNTYQQLSLFNNLPWIKNYYQDGLRGLQAAEHGLEAGLIALKAIAPYSDILGFEGEESFTGGTVEDRVSLILQTLEVVIAELDKIEAELLLAQSSLNEIDSQRYPEELKGVKVRAQILQVQELADQAFAVLSEFRPVIEQFPKIAGTHEPKKYLVLFQNNNELRPTGGFLTAYSIIDIEQGKVSPKRSDDIYELDKKFTQRIPIPESLGKYLTTERYWNLRDMNISPDFKESMDTFFAYYSEIKGEPDDLDGIIAIDTQVLTRLLEILGPVEVPGYGTFSAEIDKRCDCPQVVFALSEIITRPTPYLRENRKGILGPMMQAILQKTYEAPKLYWADLFAMSWEMIKSRHLQMYFIDEQAQLASENADAAGRLTPTEDGDFLAIVDANLGGAKSNLFTEYDVQQFIEGPVNGYIHKTIEITYRNNRKADNCNLEAGLLCLNATAPTWHRLYLPAGTKLNESQGFADEPNLYEELGFQVIDGFFKLDPMGAAKIRVSYEVPYNLEDYKLFIWKQGGVKSFDTIIDVNGYQTQLLVDHDLEFEEKF